MGRLARSFLPCYADNDEQANDCTGYSQQRRATWTKTSLHSNPLCATQARSDDRGVGPAAGLEPVRRRAAAFDVGLPATARGVLRLGGVGEPKTKLLNPLQVVKWSSDKHYLGDLAGNEVPTVLTKFVEPDEHPERQIAELLSEPEVDEFVVKPAVGAGSRDAQRFGREEKDDASGTPCGC